MAQNDMALQSGDCVFLVDDDEDDRFLVQQVFQKQSPTCSIKALHNGEALLSALGETPALPNLVLLDLNMPHMDGFEALQAIRRQNPYATLPVVILTTSDQAADKKRADDLRADGFITKPSTVEQYNQVVLQLRNKWLSGKCA